MLRITLPDGSVKQVKDGTTFAEIGTIVNKNYDSPLAAAVLNGTEYSLRQPVMEDGDVDFIPLNSVEGMRAFTRSITFVCIVAMKELFPDTEMEVCNSLGSALYCIMPKNPLDHAQLKLLEDKMREIVAAKYPIESFPVDRK